MDLGADTRNDATLSIVEAWRPLLPSISGQRGRSEIEMLGARFIAASAVAVTILGLRIGLARAAELERYDALANSPMAENRPTPETSQLLKDELLFQRATQTYLWALPLINTLGMKVGSEKAFGAGYHVLPVWKKRLDARTLVTTPNSDVI